MIKNRADLVKMIEITKDAINRSTLENLLAHADAAGIGDGEARFLNYFGRTEDRRGAWARWLEHEKGTSGATRLCRLLREQRLAKYYVRSSRVLAHGKDNWETQQLEASRASSRASAAATVSTRRTPARGATRRATGAATTP